MKPISWTYGNAPPPKAQDERFSVLSPPPACKPDVPCGLVAHPWGTGTFWSCPLCGFDTHDPSLAAARRPA